MMFVAMTDSCSLLFADAEVTICKYKWLIINVNAFVLG